MNAKDLWIILAHTRNGENYLIVNYIYLVKYGRLGLELWTDYDKEFSCGLMKWVSYKELNKYETIRFKNYTGNNVCLGLGKIIAVLNVCFVVISIDNTEFNVKYHIDGISTVIIDDASDKITCKLKTDLDEKIAKMNKRLQLLNANSKYYTDGIHIILDSISDASGNHNALSLNEDPAYVANVRIKNQDFIDNEYISHSLIVETDNVLDYINIDQAQVEGVIKAHSISGAVLKENVKADKIYNCYLLNDYLDASEFQVIGYHGIIYTGNSDEITIDFKDKYVRLHKLAFYITDTKIKVLSTNEEMRRQLKELRRSQGYRDKIDIAASMVALADGKYRLANPTDRFQMTEQQYKDQFRLTRKGHSLGYTEILTQLDMIKRVQKEGWFPVYFDDIWVIGLRYNENNKYSFDVVCKHNGNTEKIQCRIKNGAFSSSRKIKVSLIEKIIDLDRFMQRRGM